jgi:anti-sigma B factor antagonist
MTCSRRDEDDVSLRCTATRSRAVVDIAVVGEVDHRNHRQLIDGILMAVDERIEAIEAVVVDLAGVSFLGSAGVHALLDAQQQLAPRGVSLFLRDVSDIMARVLRITGADRHLSTVSD